MESYKVDEFAELRRELQEFIGDRADLARYIVSRAPFQHDIRNMDKSYVTGWKTGFSRCLAEFHRLADQFEKEEAKKNG